MRLTPPRPYDGARLLAFLGAHAVPGIETWDGTTYAVSTALAGRDVVVAVTWEDPDLVVDAPAEALAALKPLLDADGDVTTAQRHLGVDPVLAALVAARPGLRVPGALDGSQTLLRTIVGQQVSVAGARTVTGKLVARWGRELAAPAHGVTHAFPCPEVLARVHPQDLPMPRARGRSLVSAARACADGLDVADPACTADLLALPGVGPWTERYVALRVRRDPDVFLPTDLAVRRSLEQRDLPADPSGATDTAAAWAPYRSLALMHLWTDYLETRARPARDRAGAATRRPGVRPRRSS